MRCKLLFGAKLLEMLMCCRGFRIFSSHCVCACACVKKCFKIGNVQKCGWNVRVCYTCRLQIHRIMIIIIICKHHLHSADTCTSRIIFSSLHTSLKNDDNIEKLHDLSFFRSCYLIYDNNWWFACFMLSIIVLCLLLFTEIEIDSRSSTFLYCVHRATKQTNYGFGR